MEQAARSETHKTHNYHMEEVRARVRRCQGCRGLRLSIWARWALMPRRAWPAVCVDLVVAREGRQRQHAQTRDITSSSTLEHRSLWPRTTTSNHGMLRGAHVHERANMTPVDNTNPLQALAALLQQPPRLALPPSELSSDAFAVHSEAVHTHELTAEAGHTLADTPPTFHHQQCLPEPASMAEHARDCNGTRRADLSYETDLYIHTAYHTGFKHSFDSGTL